MVGSKAHALTTESPCALRRGLGAMLLLCAVVTTLVIGVDQALAASPTPTVVKGSRAPMGETNEANPNEANPNDAGLYVAFCPSSAATGAVRAGAAGTSEQGWPPKQCLKMD